MSFQLICDPQHTAHFDTVAFRDATQRSVAREQNAVPHFLSQRKGEAIIELQPGMLI